MSTYFSSSKPFRVDSLDAPLFLKEYLNYLLVMRNLTPNTINSYYVQIRLFIRYLMCKNQHSVVTLEEIEDKKIADAPFSLIENITSKDVREFLSFSASILQNDASSRSLKLSAIKSMLRYFTLVSPKLEKDPTLGIPSPKLEKSLPKYLTLDESICLLENIDGSNAERDYCIISILLNCGLRISELTALNLNDITEDTMRIQGKGRKERLLYLNNACICALNDYLKIRASYKKKDKNALFISSRTGSRLTPRRIEQIVNDMLKRAGLGSRGFTAHKLRHTAATLSYQYKNADVLELKAILGHTSIETTELYTHLGQHQIKEAMKESPLAHIKRGIHE